MDQASKTVQRKQYRKPRLREYGDLRRLTETDIAAPGALDGGMYGQQDSKTSG